MTAIEFVGLAPLIVPIAVAGAISLSLMVMAIDVAIHVIWGKDI